ncbi:hypothetical protein [Marinimicrobium agarilyticum]|uniref:hypothetical protein n=1 Tax=Marinimicrobium agarilyticum TaxID=306546 RepID=UPI0004119FAB|nr:hypothetical protein [Marinimicrobium agarilyticum]
MLAGGYEGQRASGGQAEVVIYQSVAPGEYESVGESYPPLVFIGFEEFWVRPAQRGHYDFELLRGPLGFWQLNQGRVTGEMRKFFSDQRE